MVFWEKCLILKYPSFLEGPEKESNEYEYGFTLIEVLDDLSKEGYDCSEY